MSKTYVIADIHGRLDLLRMALSRIAEHAGKNERTIITLGNYVDRGPDSKGVIELLMGSDIICLKGNHEYMMIETMVAPLNPQWWIGNGGGATLISYGHPVKGEYDPSVVPSPHLDWIKGLPLLHLDEHRIYVHAMIGPTRSLEDQKEEVLLWGLYPDEYELGHGNYHVVHGHHQHADGPKFYTGRTNLDTGAFYTGRLVVGVFDDDKAGGPVEVLEVKGEPNTRFE